MAWSTPLTAVSNSTLTAAQWNASVRDNLLETPAAKATTAGRLMVTTGANAIAERDIATATVTTSETTASTSFTNLATSGPAVTVTTGVKALVGVSAGLSSNTSASFAQAGYAISGATTIAASLDRCLEVRSAAVNHGIRATAWHLETALTAGSNTFTMQYCTSSGGGSGTFANRRIIVIAL